MARVCQVTGKGPMVGNNVSHANYKTKRRFLPNLQNRRIFVESENRWGFATRVQCRIARDRQDRHRRRAGRYARPRRENLTSRIKESSWLNPAATKSSWIRPQAPVISTPPPKTSAPLPKKWRS